LVPTYKGLVSVEVLLLLGLADHRTTVCRSGDREEVVITTAGVVMVAVVGRTHGCGGDRCCVGFHTVGLVRNAASATASVNVEEKPSSNSNRGSTRLILWRMFVTVEDKEKEEDKPHVIWVAASQDVRNVFGIGHWETSFQRCGINSIPTVSHTAPHPSSLGCLFTSIRERTRRAHKMNRRSCH
jgi:hypothetical protein